MFLSKVVKLVNTNYRFPVVIVMRKSATTPILEKSVHATFEEDEENSLFRILSDLRRESNTAIKVLKIDQKQNIGSKTTDSTVSFVEILKTLQEDNEKVALYASEIIPIVNQYDFREVKANGYRSFLLIIQRCSTHLLNHIRSFNNKNKTINWNNSIISEIISYSECFHELVLCFYFLTEMKKVSSGGNLFPQIDTKNEKEIERLIDESDKLKQEKFFGKCLGFYYCSSAQTILQVLGSIMSGYAHSFINNKSGLSGIFNTVFQSVSCFWNPENRGLLMSSITRNATVEFTKQFWNLGEHPLVLEAPNMILPPVEVAVNFNLPSVPFTVPTKDSDLSKTTNFTVFPPTESNTQNSTSNVKLRLISLKYREGLNWMNHGKSNDFIKTETSFIKRSSIKSGTYKERSKTLLIHCHGGGFVAQSAKSHDIYLRSWAEHLDCPILSIDYSLAPEFPYPRALEECFYAVTWAMRNRRQLGCTSDAKVVLCGDSAGANLVLCTALKCINSGIATPDAIFLAYVPVLVTMTPSPSRLLASIDPLLPVGILARCLLAYVGIDEKQMLDEVDRKLKEKNSTENYSKVASTTLSNGADDTLNLINAIQSSSENLSPLSKVRLASIPLDPFMSPLLIDNATLSKLPPVSVIGSHFDPLLDDCVELCKRLDQVGVPVSLKVMHDIPHGFLNFVLVSRECETGSLECIKMIKQLFDRSSEIKTH